MNSGDSAFSYKVTGIMAHSFGQGEWKSGTKQLLEFHPLEWTERLWANCQFSIGQTGVG